METFTLSRKELHRPGLLKALCGGRLTNAQVAAALRITVRQVRRLKRRFEAGGPGALVHGHRDRPSPRRLPAVVRDAVVRLMTTVYVGFNDTHLTEKLREHHALGISRETVRRYREQLGHPPKRARRAPRVRRRRVPSAARGALIQIDGSPFPWLEDRPRADAPRRHRRRHERDPRLTVPPGRGRPWLRHAVSRRVHGPWPAHGRVRRSPEPACPQ